MSEHWTHKGLIFWYGDVHVSSEIMATTDKAVPVLQLSTMPWRRIGWVEVYLYSFFDLSTRWRWVVSSRPGRFTPRVSVSGTHCTGSWVGPRTVLDAVVKRKFPSPQKSYPRIPAPIYTIVVMEEERMYIYYICQVHNLYKNRDKIRSYWYFVQPWHLSESKPATWIFVAAKISRLLVDLSKYGRRRQLGSTRYTPQCSKAAYHKTQTADGFNISVLYCTSSSLAGVFSLVLPF
jgi:hypothetical protein